MNLNDLFNEDARREPMTPQRQQDLRNQSDYGGEDFDEKDQYGNLKRSTSPGLGGTIDIGGVSIPAAAFDAGLGSVAAMGSLGGMKGIFGKSQNTGGTTPGPNTTSTVDLGKKGLPGSDKRWAYQSSEPGTIKVKPFGEPGGEPVNAPAVMRGRNNPKFDPNLSKTDPGKTIAQREQEAADLLAKMAKLKVQQGKPRINAKDYEAHLAKQKELQQQLKDLRAADVAPPTLLPSKSPNPAAQTSDSNQVPTIKLPNGQTIPDPARVSPSGQYNTQSGSSQTFGDKEAYDAALKIRKNQWNQMKTGKEKEGEKRRSAWKNPETDVDLEEASRKKPKEVDYHASGHDQSVARLQHLAGIGPMKTVWDPTKRVYKNVPTADQPPKK
jgi:hypothetical protein